MSPLLIAVRYAVLAVVVLAFDRYGRWPDEAGG
jgi:hypothetical protein